MYCFIYIRKKDEGQWSGARFQKSGVRSRVEGKCQGSKVRVRVRVRVTG